jgi:hypothetical protein
MQPRRDHRGHCCFLPALFCAHGSNYKRFPDAVQRVAVHR